MQLELFNENIIIELELNHDINNPTSFILSKIGIFVLKSSSIYIIDSIIYLL